MAETGIHTMQNQALSASFHASSKLQQSSSISSSSAASDSFVQAVTYAQAASSQVSASSAAISRPLRIAITTGEPAGVGPELMYALTSIEPWQLKLTACCAGGVEHNVQAPIELVLIGDRSLLEQRMELYKKATFGQQAVELVDFELEHFHPTSNGEISCYHVPLAAPAQPSCMDVQNAPYVLKTLDVAIEGCMNGTFDAMVTAPISKSIICKLGLNFTGHTEYLQEKSGCKEVVMMLGCREMNVALATTHLPLKDISAALTTEKLTDVISILHHDLKYRMGFKQPKIYISGLNPHAGEDGTLGTEELETMIPVIERLKREQNFDLVGPLPADTMFQPKYLNQAAAFLTMYHDQGLPVLKYAGFDSGYNTTLGLPFIRTSVDHGTALDLAGKGKADAGSLLSAVSLAIYMAQHRIK